MTSPAAPTAPTTTAPCVPRSSALRRRRLVNWLVWFLPVPITAILAVALLLAAVPTASLPLQGLTLAGALVTAACALVAFRRWWSGTLRIGR